MGGRVEGSRWNDDGYAEGGCTQPQRVVRFDALASARKAELPHRLLRLAASSN